MDLNFTAAPHQSQLNASNDLWINLLVNLWIKITYQRINPCALITCLSEREQLLD